LLRWRPNMWDFSATFAFCIKANGLATFLIAPKNCIVWGASFEPIKVCCSMLQYVAVCCSMLQYVAVYCSMLQYVAVCCSMLQGASFEPIKVCCSMLQYVAVCCSMLQYVAVCCSVLLYVAGRIFWAHSKKWQVCSLKSYKVLLETPYTFVTPYPMNHVKIFKGWPLQDAPWKLVQLWYKSFPPGRFLLVEMKKPTILSNKRSSA